MKSPKLIKIIGKDSEIYYIKRTGHIVRCYDFCGRILRNKYMDDAKWDAYVQRLRNADAIICEESCSPVNALRAAVARMAHEINKLVDNLSEAWAAAWGAVKYAISSGLAI